MKTKELEIPAVYYGDEPTRIRLRAHPDPQECEGLGVYLIDLADTFDIQPGGFWICPQRGWWLLYDREKFVVKVRPATGIVGLTK